MAITYKNIAGEESATVTFRVATIEMARGSTNEQQEILCLGDPLTSNAIARVVAANPASTEFGLVTRNVWSSTGPDQKVSESAGLAFTHGQVGMSTTAAQIVGANTARKRLLLIQHSSLVNVFLGPSTVTAANGLLFVGVPGNQIVLRNDDAVYGITSASTSTVSFLEETH